MHHCNLSCVRFRMVKILNLNRKADAKIIENLKENEDYEYCGRPSQYGNPFVMKSELYRQIVIDKFKKEVIPTLDLTELVTRVKASKNFYLGCYCFPKFCHCDTIKDKIEEIIENEE